MRTLLLLPAVCLLSAAAAAQTYEFTTPNDDLWQYPFNASPGSRPVASCFNSLGTGVAAFDDFNDRDGIFLIAWDTSALIGPGQGASAYDVQAVTITLTNESGAVWLIDTSTDEWFTFDVNNDTEVNIDGVPRGQPGDSDGESDDADAGRPLELFGAGFGPHYTYADWDEFDPYAGGRDNVPAPRDPFPFVWDAAGNVLHVEESVQGGWNDAFGVFNFTPAPWALGVPVGYTPAAQAVPFEVVFDVDLALFDERVRDYFRQQLDAGRVIVSVTGMTDTVQGGTPDGFPSFFTKEGVGLEPGAQAPRLTIVLGDAQQDGDVDGDGCVNITDLGTLLSNYNLPSGAEREDGDLNGDGRVDITDLGVLLANFGAGSC